MIVTLSINETVFVGLFGLLTDKYGIVSENFPDKEIKKINPEIPILKTKIYNTDLIGMFCAGNSKGLVIPDFVTDKERKKIENFCNQNDINFGVINNNYNAFGNLISCNDNGCIISEKISDENISKIEKILKVKCVKAKIKNIDEVGSRIFVTNKGFLAHPDAKEQIDFLKEIFKVDGNIGTLNLGFQYIRLGILGNSNNLFIGDETSAIEIENICDCLKVY